jgi:hypothetical protein
VRQAQYVGGRIKAGNVELKRGECLIDGDGSEALDGGVLQLILGSGEMNPFLPAFWGVQNVGASNIFSVGPIFLLIGCSGIVVTRRSVAEQAGCWVWDRTRAERLQGRSRIGEGHRNRDTKVAQRTYSEGKGVICSGLAPRKLAI